MIAELGVFSLILALFFAIFLTGIPVLGFFKTKSSWLGSPAFYAPGLFFSVALAYGALTLSFLNNDFGLSYVYLHSSVALPWFYKFCAVWGGHEGSMLLWIVILSAWTLAFELFSGSIDKDFRALVLAVLGFLSAGFILFLLMTSNPFLRLPDLILTEGRDLNPLLQDLGFLLHPPVLYIGYVGFALAFAFAAAGLLLGRFESPWAKWVKPWTLLAWCFLTLGITLGSWWAYRELGWGGWWFWDPVENASLMPWLSATALLHGLTLAEKRQQFLGWILFLALLTFALSLVGSFLVRSGVLTSVHAFAVDPKRGLYILVFLSLIVGGSLTLFAVRASSLKRASLYAVFSRESALLLASLLLVVILFTVLMGTLYPLIIDGLGLGKLSVGAPYFNTVILPLGLPLLFFMGFGIHLKWNKDSFFELLQTTGALFLFSFFLAFLLLWFWAPFINGLSLLGLSLSLWIIVSTFKAAFSRLNAFGLKALSPSFLTMVFAHVGLAISVIGISLSTGYGIEGDLKFTPGKPQNFAGFKLTLMGEKRLKGSNYEGTQAVFKLEKGSFFDFIYPEKRFYTVAKTTMTDAGIDVTLFRDLYLALGEGFQDGSWVVRLYFKPFVRWIWAGGFLLLLGGFLGLSPRLFSFKLRKSLKLEARTCE